LTVSAASFAIRLPVTVSPVIETIRTFGCVTSSSPMSAPDPSRTFTTPAEVLGEDLGEAQSRERRPDDGLRTTVLPVASAGPSFHVAM
jgi:hypothetical protein